MSLRDIIFLPATVNKGRLSNWIIICGLIFLLLSCTPSQQIKPPTVVTTNLDKHSPTVTQPISTPEAVDKTKNENHQSANSPSSVNIIKSIEQSFSSIYEDTKQSVVNIQIATRTQDQFEARGCGSGFVCDKLGQIHFPTNPQLDPIVLKAEIEGILIGRAHKALVRPGDFLALVGEEIN